MTHDTSLHDSFTDSHINSPAHMLAIHPWLTQWLMTHLMTYMTHDSYHDSSLISWPMTPFTTHWLTCLLTHWLMTHFMTHMTHSMTHAMTHDSHHVSMTHSFHHSLTHWLTQLLTRWLTWLTKALVLQESIEPSVIRCRVMQLVSVPWVIYATNKGRVAAQELMNIHFHTV